MFWTMDLSTKPNSPGEHQQSGSTQAAGLQMSAPLGSSSTPHATSSEPSRQSGLVSQNSCRLMHSPSPHCSWPSGHCGVSVLRLG